MCVAHAQFVGRALCDICRPVTKVVRDVAPRTDMPTTGHRGDYESSKQERETVCTLTADWWPAIHLIQR